MTTAQSYLDDSVYRIVQELREPGAIAAQLAQAWSNWCGTTADDIAVGGASVSYDPFRRASMQARATIVTAGDSGSTVDLDLLLEIHGEVDEFRRACDRAVALDGDGAGASLLFTIDGLRTIGWTLPSLREATTSRRAIGAHLLTVLVDTERGSSAAGAALRRLNSRHSQRRNDDAVAAAAVPKAERFAVKLLAARSLPAAVRAHRLIDGARRSGLLPFTVSELVRVDEDRGILVTREPGGDPFDRVLQRPHREPFERLGRALAALHRSDLRPTRVVSTADLLDSSAKAAARIERALPELAGALRQVLASIRLAAPDADEQARRASHAALDAGCVVCRGGTVGIGGWSHLALAHPYVDIASLIANMIESAEQFDVGASVMRASVRAFAMSYAQAVGASIQRRLLSWHLAVALIRRAGSRSLGRLDAGWYQAVCAQVFEASALMAERSTVLRRG